MGIVKDLTGQRFYALTVIEQVGLSKRNYADWRCRCDCGNEIIVDTARLRAGTARSCGCGSRPADDFCSFNHGVICEDKDACPNCGWNPDVEERRKENRK